MNGHSSINRKIIWSVLGQGLGSTGGCDGVSCIVVGQRRARAVDSRWECPSWDAGGSRISIPRHGALSGAGEKEPAVPSPTPPGLGKGKDSGLSLWDFTAVLRGNQGEGILGQGIGEREQDGGDTCEPILLPPWGSPDKAAAA